MDNFPSFTELGQLPDWYEGEDAGRALAAGAAARCMSKMAENLGVWSLHSQLLGSRPSASGNRIRGKQGKIDWSYAQRAPGAQGPALRPASIGRIDRSFGVCGVSSVWWV